MDAGNSGQGYTLHVISVAVGEVCIILVSKFSHVEVYMYSMF